jgi:type II secretory pathway component PulM
MNALTARERRLLAIGLLVIALGLVWLGIVQPLVGGFIDRAAQRRQLGDVYLRNERLIAALPVWRAAAEAQRRDAARFAILAPGEAAAAEAMKARLQRLATDEGFAVKGVEDLQADAAPGDVRIRADATLTLTQLYETLRRLENEGAYVAIDYLSVSADAAASSGRSGPLDVRLELSADWRPGGSRP